MTVIETIRQYDEFTSTGGGGTSQLNGNVGGKQTAVINGYFYRAAIGKYLQFLPNGGNGTITNINPLDGSSWIQLGFVVGAIITVEGSPTSDGTYTLTAVTDTMLTTDGVLADEAGDGCDVYDDTPVSCVDFYYNLIENSNAESYYSLVDAGAIQRFSSDGYDLTGQVGVAQNMLVASESFGWVTNTLSDPDTGETSQVTITNVSTTNHKQYFEINHIYYIEPLCLVEQKNDFDNEKAPSYLIGGKSLKYIAKVEGNITCGCGLADGGHTGSKTTPDGCVAWYNQNNKRTRTEYYFDSIAFSDVLTAPVDEIDINNVTNVTITIKSRTGKFVAGGTPTNIALAFTYFPLNRDRYIYTPDTLLRDNFIYDRRLLPITSGANGENYGTDYQVIKQIVPAFVDVNTIQVVFKVDFSSALKTLFQSLPVENRNYFFSVMTQDATITTTEQSDRVNILCPLSQIGWDKEITDLIAPWSDLYVNQFPETDLAQGTKNVAGYEGDPIALEFPFTLLQPSGLSPTILNSGFQIVATKKGGTDYVLEGKIFDTSLVRKLDGVQTIDITETRDFEDMIDAYRDITLLRDASYDITGAVGFTARYPFVLRYEYWADLLQASEQYLYEIFEDIETPTKSWDSLQSDGWSLQVKFKAQATAYDGYTQDYCKYWDITVAAFGDAPADGPALTCQIIYEDIDEDIEVKGLLTGKKTKVTIKWSGDLSGSAYNSLYAYIFADYEEGGINTRRFASSEFDADDDCPFTSESLYDLSGSTDGWGSENAHLSVFGNDYVILQTIYDDSIENWTKTKREVLILPRIGFFTECFILGQDGDYMLDEFGQRIEEETC